MKRFAIVALLLVFALALSAGLAGAAPNGPSGDRDGVRDLAGPGQGLGNGKAYGFVDANADGINDRFVDANLDGQCDNDCQSLGYERSKGSERGPRAEGQRNQGQTGKGQGQRMANFVDADGDGVCDLLQQR